VRVGREPIDPEAMQLLEQHNPDISFDWARLLKQVAAASTGSGSPAASASPASASSGSRDERRRERRDQRRRLESSVRHGGAILTEHREEAQAAESAPEETEEARGEEDPETVDELVSEFATEYTEYTKDGDAAELADTEDGDAAELADTRPDPVARSNGKNTEPGEPSSSEPQSEPQLVAPEHLEPEPFGPEPLEPEPPGPEPLAPEPLAPRYARLGPEGLIRLRARYADIAARLQAKERELEGPQRAELTARVERLNPDVWLTDDEVVRALEDYEAIFESLRPIIGRPSRRRRS
jgi:hypothetical protein